MDWPNSIPKKAAIKCRYRIKQLKDLGHNLRRPEADRLQDGIYELRIPYNGIQFRILYFFYGRIAAIVSHGISKEHAKRRRTELEDIRANDLVSTDLYTLREKAGLTQEQMAEKAGTDSEIVDRIELNDFEEFTIDFMQQYARVLGKRLEVRIVESEAIAQRAEAKDQPAA